jgi:hypothetical protein
MEAADTMNGVPTVAASVGTPFMASAASLIVKLPVPSWMADVERGKG